jgi:hypothetical protein
MEGFAGTEKIIAIIGAVVVGTFAIIALCSEWRKTGLDDNVTKILLALMAFGCVLVILAGFNVLPSVTGANTHPGVG